MLILAIDPGPKDSAWVVYDGSRPTEHGHENNDALLQSIRAKWFDADVMVVEKIAAMGMAVGAEVFDTAQWSGRFIEAQDARGRPWAELKRHEVKMHLCGSMRAKDPNVRQALMDRFGGSAARGTKKKPGPLYGISGDRWSALAVAVTFAETLALSESGP